MEKPAPPPKNRIIWTRSLADWAHDVSLFPADASPHLSEVLHLPCIALRALPLSPLGEGLKNFAAAAFTSSQAVHFFLAESTQRQLLQSIPLVFAIGAQTAATLQTYGFTAKVPPGNPGGKSLGAYLAKELPTGSHILWPRAKTPAYDFAPDLKFHGILVTPLPVYETLVAITDHSGQTLTSEHIAALISSMTGVVCFASPSAVASFAAAFRPNDNRLRTALTAATIGPTTAQAADGLFERCAMAPQANIADLAQLARGILAVN